MATNVITVLLDQIYCFLSLLEPMLREIATKKLTGFPQSKGEG